MTAAAPRRPVLALGMNAESLLAPYAARSSLSLGRKYSEPDHPLRSCFQRDRDRVVHSTAFRRLQYKTQVFVNHEGDHYRTRLTHTLETSQIARSIARVLRLNEDLAEAVSLAHDIGHGPFGHAGEWALREMMEGHGGFEHNRQSLRIVELLEERYPNFPGLNLSYETLEGLKKHPERHGLKRLQRYRTLEADLVDLADEIAYASHDLDDGLRSGLLVEEKLSEIQLWAECDCQVCDEYPGIEGTAKKRLIIRLIIDKLVKDTVESSRERIRSRQIRKLADLQHTQQPIIVLSDRLKRQHAELKRFLKKHLYMHRHVKRMTDRGQRIIRQLFKKYMQLPAQLPADVRDRSNPEGLARAVCDYIAGMTDRYVGLEHQRLCGTTSRTKCS